MDPNNFQRVGAISNAHAGREFEDWARQFFLTQGIVLRRQFAVPIGVGTLKRPRKFDLGSDSPAILIECKSHTWTVGGNNPSAKITVWNEAMYLFHIAPENFRKILFVLKSTRSDLTLAEHYLKNQEHLIPAGVEFWEFDPTTQLAGRLR